MENAFFIKSIKYDFKFFEDLNFFDMYNFQGNDNFIFFSNLFFFNTLQVSDFTFLHKDFYFFYPIFKYMSLCELISGNLSIEDIAYMRNCIIKADSVDLDDLKDELIIRDVKKFYNYSFFSSENFEKLVSNQNAVYFDNSIVKKFFFCFLNTENSHQFADDDFFVRDLNRYYVFSFDKLSREQSLLFYYTFNKGFNGILEMFHFFNRIRVPKKFILLQDNVFFSKDYLF